MIAASELLHRMGPADKVALVMVPQPGQRIEFTNDIEEVKRGLSRITGRRQTRIRTVRLSFDEAQAVERNEQRVIASILERECAHRYDATCPEQVRTEAGDVLDENRERIMMTLSNLSGLADSLAGVDGPRRSCSSRPDWASRRARSRAIKEVARRAAERG